MPISTTCSPVCNVDGIDLLFFSAVSIQSMFISAADVPVTVFALAYKYDPTFVWLTVPATDNIAHCACRYRFIKSS